MVSSLYLTKQLEYVSLQCTEENTEEMTCCEHLHDLSGSSYCDIVNVDDLMVVDLGHSYQVIPPGEKSQVVSINKNTNLDVNIFDSHVVVVNRKNSKVDVSVITLDEGQLTDETMNIP